MERSSQRPIRRKSRAVLMLTAGVAFTSSCGSDSASESISLHRGNAQRTGVFAGPAPAKPSEALWRINANVGYGALVAAGGRVYFRSATGVLHAVDASSGATKWTYGRESKERELPLPRPGAPTVANGTVYFPNAEGLHALTAETGQVRWSIAAPSIESHTLANGTVFVGGRKALQAINAASGQERWRFGFEEVLEASWVTGGPVVAQGLVFVGLTSGDGAALIAIDAGTGQQRWVLRDHSNVSTEPEGYLKGIAVDDGIVYFGLAFGITDRGSASFRAVDAATGREKWRRSALHSSLFACPEPVIAGAMAYFVAMEASAGTDGPASLYALDAKTGEERWRRQLDLKGDDRVLTELTFVDGTVYMGLGRALAAIDPKTGQDKWRFQTDEHVYPGPTVSNGVIYFGGRGVLRAIR